MFAYLGMCTINSLLLHDYSIYTITFRWERLCILFCGYMWKTNLWKDNINRYECCDTIFSCILLHFSLYKDLLSYEDPTRGVRISSAEPEVVSEAIRCHSQYCNMWNHDSCVVMCTLLSDFCIQC